MTVPSQDPDAPEAGDPQQDADLERCPVMDRSTPIAPGRETGIAYLRRAVHASSAARQVAQAFGVVERILRDRVSYYGDIHCQADLTTTSKGLLTAIVLGLGVFGSTFGLAGGNVRALQSMVKLPVVVLLSGAVCLPTLYYFSVLFGSRLRIRQAIVLILTAQTVSAVLALGFTPVTLLFLLSGAELRFVATLSIFMLALSSSLGLIFLLQGVLYVQEEQAPVAVSFPQWVEMLFRGALRSLVLLGWIVLYGLVGHR